MFKRKDYKEKQLRYSIRKVSFGAASVAIASLYLFMGSSAVSASEVQPVNGEQNTVTNTEEVKKNEKQTEETDIKKGETLDKTSLTKLIEEIDGKFTNGKYTSKTEDSVNQLKAALEAAKTALSTAKTQAELTQAHANLIVATTKLQTKALDKKEAPVVDTTNGKATVGIKATNTEKASESNSIANSGSKDERNGKEMDKNNPLRTDAATTDTDPAAHQTYTLPGDSASVGELADKLKGLDSSISNETKLASIDEVGRHKNVRPGEIKEIDEFGGWSAITADGNKGKFAIARKTDEGVYPIETVNVTRKGSNGNERYVIHVEENAFDRTNEYALFLSKVRTYATKNEETFDRQPFKDVDTNGGVGEGPQISRGLKGFNGIEKTYKAYSSSTGTGVNISFKTGFTGDIDGVKAGYKVEVIAKFEDGRTKTIYTESFLPTDSTNNGTKNVAPVDANDNVKFEVKRSPEPKANALNQQLATYKNRQVNKTGSFTSKNIDLPKGATEYTVRISASDNSRLGMGYQTTWSQYALPVSGFGFTITQDTNRIAKTLLQRIYNKLIETEERDTKGKTEATINTYKTQLDNVKNLLAGDLKETQDYKDMVTAVLRDQQALRTDKSKLDTSNNKLLDLINETPDPRIGKTPKSITPYDSAKDEAKKAQTDAQSILNQENPDPDIVAAAVSKLNEKLAELKAARAELVVAATEDQKTKLKNDSDALKPADTNGKTPKSIEAYNARYKQLEEALNKAKEEAKKVLAKEVNAGKVEATDAQIEVDKIKAELDKAAALLKDKGNTDELENAKNELKIAAEVPNVTDGKTKGTSDKYDAAKTAAEQAVTAAEAVISDINSTTEEVADALAKVNEKKAALEAAKAALVDKVTPEQKTALGNAETDLAVLGDADLAGKTEESKEAYKAEVAKLNAEIEAAKQAAAAIVADADNKTQAEAALAQAKVETLKAKLEAAKAKLVDKADKAALTAAKEALDGQTKEEDPTSGKTTATAEAYKAAKTAAEEAVREAEAIIAKDNATPKEVADALAKVNEKKAALEAAKAALVDKVTPEQKTALGNAETDLAVLGDADLAGKTEESKEAYKAEVAKLNAEIEAAKQAAAAIVADADNKTQAEAALAQAKVETLKAKLEAAKAKLVDKADKAALTAAKEALDGQTKEEDPTSGKTTATAEAYKAAKTAAEEAVREAEAIIAKDNATPKEVADALAKVNEKKAALEAAKAALVDKVTPEQKTALGNAETDLAVLGDADLAGKTEESKEAYKAEVAKLNAEIEAAKQAAAAIVADADNKTQAEAALAQAKVETLKAKLEAAKAKLVDKADKAALTAAKEALDGQTKEEDPTSGKTTATAEAYKAAKTAAEEAVREAEAIIAKDNATPKEVADALAKVNEKKAALEAAKAALVDKVTPEQKTALGNAETDLAVLGDADLAGKTEESKEAYKAEVAKLNAEIEAAKQAAAAIVADADNKTQAEAALAQAKVETLKAKLEAAKAKLVDKADKAALTAAKEALDGQTKEEDPTSGKTTATAEAYKAAKTAAEEAVREAEAIIAKDNATPKEVADALAKVNEKKAALEAAKAALVDKVTPEQKTALGNAETDLAVLGDADLAGKTEESKEAYKAEVAKLNAEIEAAKQAAAAIVADADNKTQAEAALAQAKVETLKAKLEAAKAKLVDKADKAALTAAKEALDGQTKEDPTSGKTTATAEAYKAAKTAAEEAVREAEAIIAKDNATPKEVADALAKVNEKKAALEAAKAALVDKVTPEQKTALGNAETDLAVLGDADLAGKTEESKEAYKAEVAKLNAEIEAAKQAAAAIVADADNKTQAEAALAQAKVETLKAKLEAAKAKLVDKADKAALTAAKEALDGQTKEEDPTSGKTTATAEAYKAAKTAAEEAVREAEAIIAKDNATPKEVADALAKVNEKKAALEAAKAALVDKVTPEQKTALGNAETDLAVLGDADLAGKTEESKEAYKAEVAKLNAEIEAAKQAAAAIVADADNKTQAEAALAQAKVETLKAKLEAAKAKLVDKADKAALTAAKEALDGQTKEEDPTSGKTTATAEAYKAAKTAAEEAVREAEAIIAKDNATPKEVADALAKVNEKKAALEAAKAALVDKVTPEQKTALGNAETDLAVLGDADLAGKTEESKEAYKAEVAKLNAEIEAAKQAAAAIVADADNKTQAEAALAQAKVETLKAKLEAAKAKLVDKADKAALTAAKEALDGQTKEDPTSGKTTATAEAYKAAKTAAEEAVREAEAIIAKDNATPKEVADALAKVNEKKAALEAAKAALVDKVTPEQKTALGNAETDLAVLGDADLAGKTEESKEAYKAEVAKLNAEIEAAKQAAAAIVADADNKTQAEAALAQAKVETLKAKLEAAKAKLVDKADKAALTAAKEALDGQTKEEDPTSGKTTATAEAYKAAKTAAEEAVREAEAIIAKDNATPKEVADALAKVNEKKAALEAAKAALVDKVTPEQKTALGNAETDLAVLGDADLAGKTEESKEAYKAEVAKLNAEIEAAKQAAAAIVADADNKTQAEAALAQAKVETLKAKLEAAKAKLVDKAAKAALTAAKEALDGQTKEEDPTSGKTTATAEAYKAAKTAAEEAVREAEAIIAKDNATPKEVADALAKVNEKKAALEAAKAALVDKVTPEQKTALGNAETDLAVLGDADLAGKTEESKEAYKAEVAKLNAEIEAAKQAAAAIVADADNKTQAEAALAQAKVETLKAKLEAAKAKLVDKADKAALTAAKEALDGQTKEEDPTSGKTTATAEAYKAAKTAAEEAVREAEAIIAKDNATPKEVADALVKVNEKKAALEAAKAALVDKVTPEQKTALGNAETDLAVLGDADLAGKTEESKEAYKAEVAKLNAEIEAAKQAAAAIVADADNKTQAEAALAQAKVETLKAKLEAAKAKLVDKADKAALTAAKEALDGQTKEEDPTSGKTTATAEAYKAAKTAAEEAVREAEAIIAKDNATPKEVADALAKVNEKKAALEAAKAALLDKITQDQKDDLANAEENLKLADTTGKAKDSVKAYNDEVAKLSDELAAAKQAAKDLVDKGDNAGELEAYRVQAKINKLKSKLAEAAKLLKDIDKSAAKKEVEDAAKNANDAIDDNADLTPEQKEAVKAKVAEEATKAIGEIDKATNEDAVTAAKNAGKFAIEKEAAKAEIEAAKAVKEKAIDARTDLTQEEKEAAKKAAREEAEAAKKSIDKATTSEDINKVLEDGKENIAKINPESLKDKAKKAIDEALATKEKAIDARTDLTQEEKEAAKKAAREEAEAAKKAIDKATTSEDINKVLEDSKENIAKINPESLKDKAKKAIDEALAAKEKAIDARTDLTQEEKEAAKKAAREEAEAAKKAIDKATTSEDINKVLEDSKENIAKINPESLKDKAKKAIDEALAAKEKAIDARTDLTQEEKEAAKKAAREEAEAAKKAIDKATTSEDINKVLEDGKENIAKINPESLKDKAKKAIDEALATKEKAIDARTDLTQEEKEAAKKAAREEAEASKKAIDKATTSEDINKVLEDSKENIAKINPESLKDKAKKAIDEALAAKEKAIDARTDLTQEEKEAAKKAAREEAEAAKKAIDKATTSEDINKVLEDGKENIAKINPESLKDKAKKAIDEALATKEKAIDARTDLTQEEKEAAKKAAREEAEASKKAIDKATTSEDINKVLEDSKENIAKINPESLKDKAKKAIDEALAAKEKAIDARTDLTQEEKEAAKKAAREEAEAAKKAIDKATTSEDINKVLEDGKENIAKINPESLKDKAKKAIDEALATKEKAIDARTDLTQEEKEAAKKAAREEAEAAKKAIDKATTSEDINKVLEDGKENIAKINPVGTKEDSKKSIEERLTDKENRQPNNTPVKPQEDAKPAEVPSDNSEQPAVNQTEDVKVNSSTTSQESKASNQKVLPNTGTGNEISIFGSAAMTVLASLGLVATSKKKEEE